MRGLLSQFFLTRLLPSTYPRRYSRGTPGFGCLRYMYVIFCVIKGLNNIYINFDCILFQQRFLINFSKDSVVKA